MSRTLADDTGKALPSVKLRPTRFGWVFLVMLLGMLLGSFNHRNNLGLFLTFLAAGVTLASALHTRRSLQGVRLISGRADPVFAGETALFDLAAAPVSAPRRGLEAAFRDTADPADGDRREVTRFNLLPDVQALIRLPCPAPRRGLLRPGPLVLASEYPFGLFRVEVPAALDLECLVYPRPATGPVVLEFGRTRADDGEGHGEGADDFRELRAYVPGDPLQRLAWRASSRGQGLFVKQFQGQYRPSAMLDWDALPPTDPESKLSLLCAMVLQAREQDLAFGLRLPGLDLSPERGEAQARRCLEALALFDAASTPSLRPREARP